MAARRSLKFERIEEIMPEVDRLMNGGYTAVGRWSLGRICNHLTGIFIYSVEGYPMRFPWIVRATVGKLALAMVFKTNGMPAGLPVPKQLAPKPDLDDRAEVETLRAAIGQYLANPTQRAFHPIFGNLGPERTDRLNCIHSAHHLSFLIPNA